MIGTPEMDLLVRVTQIVLDLARISKTLRGISEIKLKIFTFILYYTHHIHQILKTDLGIHWVSKSGFLQSCLDNIPTPWAPKIDLPVRVGQFVLGMASFPQFIALGILKFPQNWE